jgi:hypothetical protein
MLQRINTVLIALVAIGLIVVGIGTWQQQAQTAAAFEQINEKLTGMAAPVTAERPSPQPATPEYVAVASSDGRRLGSTPLQPDASILTVLEQTVSEQLAVPSSALRVDIVRFERESGLLRGVLQNVAATSDYRLQGGEQIRIVGADAELPWILFSAAEVDRDAIEASSQRMFVAGPEAPAELSIQSVFNKAAALLDLRLVMLPADVEENEFELDRTIPTRFLESLTIQQALDYACLFGGRMSFDELSWDVHDGSMIVGSLPFIASRAAVTATYRVDDLLGPFPSRDDYQDLREVLTTAANFDHWRENGGAIGMYTEVEDSLVITTIPRYHRTISAVLQSLHDPQRQYPRTSLPANDWFQTWLTISNTAIGSGVSADTTVVEAIRHAIDAADLPVHIVFDDLETIGFEGENTIRTAPEAPDSAARLLSEWLGLASPDDFDRAGWRPYGGGIAVASERTLQQIRSARVYDIGTLKLGADDEFIRAIAQLIQTRVDFDGWRDNGGDTGIMQTFGDLLIITTTDANHIEIVRLLDEYRAANAVVSSDRSAATNTSPGTVYIRGLIERPGAYNLPDRGGSFTFSRLIAAAGGLSAGFDRTALLYAVQRFVPEQGHTTIFLDWDKLDGFALLEDDLVDITQRPRQAEP